MPPGFNPVGCHFFLSLAFVMCRETKLSTSMTSSWHDASVDLQRPSIVPLSIHSLSNTELLCRRGLLSHVFCSPVCVVSAALVQTAVNGSHIFVVDTAFIE